MKKYWHCAACNGGESSLSGWHAPKVKIHAPHGAGVRRQCVPSARGPGLERRRYQNLAAGDHYNFAELIGNVAFERQQVAPQLSFGHEVGHHPVHGQRIAGQHHAAKVEIELQAEHRRFFREVRRRQRHE